VEYHHVHLVAKVIPPQEMVDEVADVADAYWAKRSKHVAIHCAYGFNRTGFVVCSYLCQRAGLSVQGAGPS
jgi:alpha-glucan,water dikinase